jgi:hypothetical protein
MDIVFQVFGWLGAFGLLLAYFLNSRKILTSDDKKYQWINLIFASLLVLNAYHIRAYPFLIINLFWAIVALVSLFQKHEIEKKTA